MSRHTKMVTTSVGSGNNGGLADEMAVTHNNLMGHLELSPKYVQKFVNKECHDKDPTETYKDYCERLQGTSFDYKKWKRFCSFSWKKFETDRNPNDMDVTALWNLFHALFKVKSNLRNTSTFIMNLKNVKDLWNGIMHSRDAAKDAEALGKLEAALNAFIQEAGSFYSLPANEIQDLQNELQVDIQAGFSPGKKRLLYACACMVQEGWDTMKKFFECKFETEDLMFSMGKVKRTDVFYELEVVLRVGKKGETFSFSKIFERTEKFLIVSGVAGAGKSTLLENIALQFVKPQTTTSAHLQDFDLLVYIHCRDHTTKTLSQVLTQQFREVRSNLGEDMVLEALLKLRVLFLIDGYDEYSHTMTVLQEVIKIIWQANCQVIITTRPHGVEPLKKLLSHDNVDLAEFEIVPLTELEQQLNFIEKHEQYLPGNRPTGAVRESFKTLPSYLQILFTEPLKLLQFCKIYVNMSTNITSWRNANDVARATFRTYNDLVEEKLAGVSYPDLNIVIDDIFLVIGEAALEFLRSNTLTFTENQFMEVQRKCRGKLKEEHGIKDLDTMKVLSCALKMKRPHPGKGNPTFSFSHKTDQEYFAAKFVVHTIEHSNICMQEILFGEESPTYEAFLEVLQYVVQDLSAKSPRLFAKRWPELKEALQEAGARYRTWRDLVLRCSDDLNVVKRVAEAAKSSDSEWWCMNGRDVDAVALMLPHKQPDLLRVVKMHPRDLRNTRWAEVIQHRQGRLLLRMEIKESCDDVLAPLHNSWCQLVVFKGAIAAADSVAVLSSVAVSASVLTVHLLTPLSLSALQGRCRILDVYVRALEAADGGVWPLPAQPSPWLRMTDVQQGTWRDVVYTVQAYAPHGNRYKGIVLQSHHLDEGELDRMVAALQQRGTRTQHTGTTRWEKWGVCWSFGKIFIGSPVMNAHNAHMTHGIAFTPHHRTTTPPPTHNHTTPLLPHHLITPAASHHHTLTPHQHISTTTTLPPTHQHTTTPHHPTSRNHHTTTTPHYHTTIPPLPTTTTPLLPYHLITPQHHTLTYTTPHYTLPHHTTTPHHPTSSPYHTTVPSHHHHQHHHHHHHHTTPPHYTITPTKCPKMYRVSNTGILSLMGCCITLCYTTVCVALQCVLYYSVCCTTVCVALQCVLHYSVLHNSVCCTAVILLINKIFREEVMIQARSPSSVVQLEVEARQGVSMSVVEVWLKPSVQCNSC
ncbi:P-loop containing nucleoside triphosphate hydrolase [Trinorchestia longiramus]|nr:P-loop containing nucleoside triphosphate hydrolase [Trinorchestia longiramus]